ncbi:MAG: T9SS type A sorting domain-containing protein [Bacteroidetes bacterium]|nr:T9SS type A sorting domain-containing protein [Bacteroidota bacterium]
MRRLFHISLILLLSAMPVWAAAQQLSDLSVVAAFDERLLSEAEAPGNLSMPYPNPASEHTSLQYDIPSGYNQATLRVFDMLGKQVLSYALQSPSGNITIPVRTLKNGIYFCALDVDGKTQATRKLVVSR